MNEQIAKLYDQAIVLESNSDYVAGELDPVKFAELIVKECAQRLMQDDFKDFRSVVYIAGLRLKEHFGVEE